MRVTPTLSVCGWGNGPNVRAGETTPATLALDFGKLPADCLQIAYKSPK